MALLATTQPGEKHGHTSGFTVTNATATYALNADTAAAADISDVLSMVIAELIKKGILNGTVNS